MKFLIDTHIFIWAFQNPQLLSASALAFIDDSGNEIFLSLASVWEMQIKINIGKMTFDQSLMEIIEFQQRVNNIYLLPIEPRHIYALSELPMHHRDPFDRLLLAQSNAEKMPILSADSVFDLYDAQILR